MIFTWRGKAPETLDLAEAREAVVELAAEVVRLEEQNRRLRRGYTYGGARPPHTRPKDPDEMYAPAAL